MPGDNDSEFFSSLPPATAESLEPRPEEPKPSQPEKPFEFFANPKSAAPATSPGDYSEIVERHAARTGLDPNLIRAVMGQESGGKRNAVSPKGARGPMQLMPATAQRFGVTNPHDPEQAIRGGADYLKFLSDKFKGNTDLMLAGYDAGEGAVDKYGGIPPYRETQAYVPAVKARYAKLSQGQQPAAKPSQPKPFEFFSNDVRTSVPQEQGSGVGGQGSELDPSTVYGAIRRGQQKIEDRKITDKSFGVGAYDQMNLPEGSVRVPVKAGAQSTAILRDGLTQKAIAAGLDKKGAAAYANDVLGQIASAGGHPGLHGADGQTPLDDAGLQNLYSHGYADVNIGDPAYEKILSSHMTEYNAALADKQLQQRKQAQADNAILQTAIKDPTALTANVAWHYGDFVAANFNLLTPQQQRTVALRATQAAAEDEKKKAAGQEIQKDANYQRLMRESAHIDIGKLLARGVKGGVSGEGPRPLAFKPDALQAQPGFGGNPFIPINRVPRQEQAAVPAQPEQPNLAAEGLTSADDRGLNADSAIRDKIREQVISRNGGEENLARIKSDYKTVGRDPAAIDKSINDQVEAGLHQYQMSQLTPQDQKDISDTATSMLNVPGFVRGANVGLDKAAMMIPDAAAGMTRILGDLTNSDKIRQLATEYQKEVNKRALAEQYASKQLGSVNSKVEGAASLVGNVIQLAALSEVVGPTKAFAASSALGTLGQTGSYPKAAVEGGKGAVYGEFFKFLPQLEAYPQASSALKKLVNLSIDTGAVATGTYALERATGSDHDKALNAALRNAAAAGVMRMSQIIPDLKLPERVIASESSPEWLREVAGKATNKSPSIFETKGDEPRFASVYAGESGSVVVREIPATEAASLKERNGGRPVATVSDRDFENIIGPTAPKPESVPANRQLRVNNEQNLAQDLTTPKPETGEGKPATGEKTVKFKDRDGRQRAATVLPMTDADRQYLTDNQAKPEEFTKIKSENGELEFLHNDYLKAGAGGPGPGAGREGEKPNAVEKPGAAKMDVGNAPGDGAPVGKGNAAGPAAGAIAPKEIQAEPKAEGIKASPSQPATAEAQAEPTPVAKGPRAVAESVTEKGSAAAPESSLAPRAPTPKQPPASSEESIAQQGAKGQAQRVEPAPLPDDLASVKSRAVKTERGTEAQYKPAVVEARDLITSLDEGYPKEFQPRDRTRAASREQISRIAQRPDPDFLGESAKASEGRPLVLPVKTAQGATKYAVISGNGRVAGLKEGYDLGTAEEYRHFAAAKSDSEVKEPVYVGVLHGDQDWTQFAREANESGVARMSAVEQAQDDAKVITPEHMQRFQTSEDGDVNTAANKDFIRDFVQKVAGTDQRGQLLTDDGRLSVDGVNRVRNAIFAKAYGGSKEGLNALGKMAEDPDNNIRQITNALLRHAGGFAELKEKIAAGTAHDLDISQDLVKAAAKLSALREDGKSVEDYLRQGGLYGQDLDTLQRRVLVVLNENKRSTRAISDILDNYLRGAHGAGNPSQAGMWDAVNLTPSIEPLWDAAIKETKDVSEEAKRLLGLAGEAAPRVRKNSRSVSKADQSKQAAKGPERTGAKPARERSGTIVEAGRAPKKFDAAAGAKLRESKEEQASKLAAKGLAVGSRVAMEVPIAGGLGGSRTVRGSVRQAKSGAAFVKLDTGEEYSAFDNPWIKAQPENMEQLRDQFPEDKSLSGIDHFYNEHQEMIDRVLVGEGTKEDIDGFQKLARSYGVSNTDIDAIMDEVEQGLSGPRFKLNGEVALERLKQSDDVEVQSLAHLIDRKALMMAHGDVGHAAVDNLIRALDKFAAVRKAKLTVNDYLHQGALFEGTGLNSLQTGMLQAFERYLGKKKDITRLVTEYLGDVQRGQQEFKGEPKAATVQGALFSRGGSQGNSTPTIGLIPSIAVEQNGHRIKLNPAAYELLRRIYNEIENRKGVSRLVGSFTGAFQDRALTNAVMGQLKTLASEHAAISAPIRRLAGAFRAAAGDTGTVIVYTKENALVHEGFHRSAELGAQGKSSFTRHANLAHLVASESFWKARQALIAKGYRATDQTNGVLVEEVAAYIWEGEHEQLGLTDDEAADYLDQWFKSYEAANGPQSLEAFRNEREEAERLISRTGAARGQRDEDVRRLQDGGQSGYQETPAGDEAGPDEGPLFKRDEERLDPRQRLFRALYRARQGIGDRGQGVEGRERTHATEPGSALERDTQAGRENSDWPTVRTEPGAAEHGLPARGGATGAGGSRSSGGPELPASGAAPGEGAVPSAPGSTVGRFRIGEFKHTMTGATMHVASPTVRLGDDFKVISAQARSQGGYWSRYKEQGAVPGFLFTSAEARDRFLRTTGDAGASEGLSDLGAPIRMPANALATVPSPRIDVAGLPGGEPKAPQKIILDFGKAIRKPVSIGKPGRGRAGAYYPGNSKTTIRFSGDLDSAAHEIAHSLDDEYGIVSQWATTRATSPYDAELIPAFSQFGQTAKNQKLVEKRAEGVAEWIRAFIVNPQAAVMAAPQFAQHFDKSLPTEVKSAIGKFSNEVRAFAGMSPVERTATNIEQIDEKRPSQRSMTVLGELNKTVFDSLAPVMNGIAMAKEMQGIQNIGEARNPETLIRAYAGYNDKYLDMIKNGLRNANGQVLKNDDGTPLNLKSLMAPLDQSTRKALISDMRDTMVLSVSERILEKAQAIQDLADKAINKIKPGPTAAAQTKRIQDLADLRKARLAGTGGGIFADDQQAQAAMMQLFGDPARLARLQEAAKRLRAWNDAQLQYWVDKGRLSQKSKDQINASNEYYASMRRLGETIDEQYVPSFLRGRGGNKLGSSYKGIYAFKGSTKRIQNLYLSAVDSAYRFHKEADRNWAVRSFTELLRPDRKMYQGEVKALAQIGYETKAGDKNSIPVWVDGAKKLWKFEPATYNALKGWAQADDPGLIARALRIPARIARATITRSPYFLARHVERYLMHSFVVSEVGAKPWDILKGYSKEDLSMYHFMGGGMGTSLDVTGGRDAYRKTIKRAIKEMAQDKSNILTIPRQLWRGYNSLVHQADLRVRMATYRRAYSVGRRQGMSDLDAAAFGVKHSRALLDWAVAGTAVKEISKYVPFVSPRVAGQATTFRAARRHPAAFFAKWAIGVLIPALLTYFWNRAAGGGVLDEYREIPAYQRDFFYNFKVGHYWLRVAKPWELGVWATGAERIVDYAMGNKHALEGWPTDLLKAITPLDEGNTIAGPFHGAAELWANKDFFRGRYIIPPDEAEKDLDLRPGTDRASRVGQLLQKALHVDGRYIDHLISGSTGDLGRMTLEASDIGRADKGPTLAGLFLNTPPVYAAEDTQYVYDRARGRGELQTPPMRMFAEQLRAYYEATTPAEKDRLGKVVRDSAAELREHFEGRPASPFGAYAPEPIAKSERANVDKELARLNYQPKWVGENVKIGNEEFKVEGPRFREYSQSIVAEFYTGANMMLADRHFQALTDAQKTKALDIWETKVHELELLRLKNEIAPGTAKVERSLQRAEDRTGNRKDAIQAAIDKSQSGRFTLEPRPAMRKAATVIR